jgi:cell surface protein SprA
LTSSSKKILSLIFISSVLFLTGYLGTSKSNSVTLHTQASGSLFACNAVGSFTPYASMGSFFPYTFTGSFFPIITYNANLSTWMMFGIQTEDPQIEENNAEEPNIEGELEDDDKNFFRVPPMTEYNTKYEKSYKSKKIPDSERKTVTDFDSTGQNMTKSATFMDSEYGYPMEMSIDEYLAMRKKKLQREMWDSLCQRYDIRHALSGGDLSRMISQATGLSIPLPPNPVLGIFGKPKISINVNGEVNLKMGWRFDTQNLGTVSSFGQTQSSPIFSQDIRVNVSAKIGDKLKFNTDWNTRQRYEETSQFKLGYEGEDDEIIRLVEFGNVQFPTPSTLIGSGQTLFGVRADFQFGPLFLKTVFSQRRGERKFVNVQGGQSRQPFQIRAYDYSKNHFFLDTAYKEVYKEYFKYSTPVIPKSASHLRVKEIEVYESTVSVVQAAIDASYGVAFADLEGKQVVLGESYDPLLKIQPIQAGKVEKASFRILDSSRYDIDYNLGTLSINNLRQDRYYAVAYRTEGPTLSPDDDYYHGTFSKFAAFKDTVILKLIYVPNLQPSFSSLWARQMKNKYSINATNINLDETEISIWYIDQNNDSADVLQGAPDKLVTIMGVDQVNNATGSPPPDGKFDLMYPFFDTRRGEITFPSLEPFRSGLIRYFEQQRTPQLADQYIFNEVYDTTYDVARLNTARDRFIITGYVSGSMSNRISLGAFNLEPGSVVITLDGVKLREFQDYVVDYFSGMLTLKNPRATLPNANLKIEYEERDLFNNSTKTLAGIRGDYELMKSRRLESTLGFTVMHYDQSALIDRVRLGEEPVSNTMMGLDGRLKWETPWLTKALDFLPFYETKSKSSIEAKGEIAMTLPTPNKRKSEVRSDNGEPVVYIDDFEGAQRYISLGLSAQYWIHSSQPVDSSIGETAVDVSYYRGKLFWYQYFIPWLDQKLIYPNKDLRSGNFNISPLIIGFDPNKRGIYNRNKEFLDPFDVGYDSLDPFAERPENRPKVWGGMQRLLSAFNTNFDTENIEYLEIMMSVKDQVPGETKLFVDLGHISEDIIPNNALDSEDGSTEANPIPNNIIDPGEDVGIDKQDNQQERDNGEYPEMIDPNGDPARDDYYFNFGKRDEDRVEADFFQYNNFEGNASISEVGQFPDTEVLNKNNGQNLSEQNEYFSYEVNLEVNNWQLNPQIVGGNPDEKWFLFRIPIRKPTSKVGNPQFSNIQYVRLRAQGGKFYAQIADWRLVGSQWQRISNLQDVDPYDSVLQTSFVNVEENSSPPDNYTMPPGVSAPRDLTSDQYRDIRLNEQSLSISVKNLRYGEERMATRIFRPLDLFYYKELKFFVHGDGAMPSQVIPGSVPTAYVFLRFGTDSSNYYEYRRPITRGWQDVKIILSELTAIKQTRDELRKTERQEGRVPGDDLAKFYIKGTPVLTRVQFFGFGIANPSENYPNELTTTMWVNELRLLSPEDRSDWAAIGNIDMKLADLGELHANITHQKPNFHKLEDRFGDRITRTEWNFSVNGNLEKFAPKAFKQMKIPISYSHAEFVEDPEFVANSDVKLEEAARAEYNKAIESGATAEEAQARADATRLRSQTLRVQDSWAITGFKLGIPIKHWLIDDTFNKITLGYSYAQETERSPVVQERFNWQWNLNAKYSVQISDFASFKPLAFSKDWFFIGTYSDLKVNLFPQTVTAGLDLVRRRQTEQSRFLDYPSPVIRDFSALQSGSFNWRFSENGFLSPALDYSVGTRSTMVPFEIGPDGTQRTGSELFKQILFTEDGWLNLGTATSHQQSVTLNIKPVFPLGSYKKYVDVTGNFTTNYRWFNPMQPDPAIADIAKQAGWNNNINFNVGLRLKAMTDDLFGTAKPASRRGPRQDTSSSSRSGTNFLSAFGRVLKTVFLDFDKMDITFTQGNNSSNPGVMGGTGISNFWSFTQPESIAFGPSLAYQLGLIEHPHGGFRMRSSSAFPWVSFDTYPGLRPPNAILQDNFDQASSLQIKMGRPLWEGATLDLNWASDYVFQKTQTVVTEDDGIPLFTNVIATETYNKTFLSMPSLFGIDFFSNDLNNVVTLFEQEKQALIDQGYDTTSAQYNLLLQNALSESFHNGLEAFSLSSGQAAKFLPSINWGIRWEGIEKWNFWDDFVTTASFEHAYQSRYMESSQITDNGKSILSQQVQIGFQPLIGVNITFDEDYFDGIFTTTVRFATTTNYQLNAASRGIITKQNTNEIQVVASYMLNGFEFPLFGLMLENELEYMFTFKYASNDRSTVDVLNYTGEDGRTLDGNTQIQLEPRIRYIMSKRVTASAFYQYNGTFTEGASNPGFASHQFGIELRIAISGGR